MALISPAPSLYEILIRRNEPATVGIAVKYLSGILDDQTNAWVTGTVSESPPMPVSQVREGDLPVLAELLGEVVLTQQRQNERLMADSAAKDITAQKLLGDLADEKDAHATTETLRAGLAAQLADVSAARDAAEHERDDARAQLAAEAAARLAAAGSAAALQTQLAAAQAATQAAEQALASAQAQLTDEQAARLAAEQALAELRAQQPQPGEPPTT